MQGMQTAWETGAAWRLRGQHRTALLERILIRRAKWRRAGGDVILQWTPAHKGVYPNHYADALAKAYVGRAVQWPYDGTLQRQASQVQYGLKRADGRVSWMAGDRRLRPMLQKRLAHYALTRAIADAAHDVGSLIIHMPDVLQQAWPWRDAWTTVLVLTSKSHDGAGSKFRPTGLGAVSRRAAAGRDGRSCSHGGLESRQGRGSH